MTAMFTAAVLGGAIGLGAGFCLADGRPISLSEGYPRSRYADIATTLTVASDIERRLRFQDAVSYNKDLLEQYGHSDLSTSNSPGRAAAVVYPRSTDDVVIIAKACHASRVPMIPYGAGSSVEGNFSQPHGGIILDMSRMDTIIAAHPDDLDVVVQPGVNWVELNTHLAPSGLFAPLDPSPTATIGGMVSTNCSGTNAFRYGTMKDWVLNLTVVLADGTVIKTRRRPRKTSAGYNLTSLFVGAEGTLGIITEVTLKLAPVPEATSVAAVPFPTIHAAASAASALIHSGTPLAALELMDDKQMELLNRHGSPAVRSRLWPEAPTLFLRFSGTAPGILVDAARTKEILLPFVAPNTTMHFAATKAEEHDIWAARKEALFTMVSTRPSGTEIWSTDVAVPISRLLEIIEVSKEECSGLGIWASVIGHVGDGNFHVAMLYDPRNEEQRKGVEMCVKRMMARALEMEGTVSGEHGVGIGKMSALEDEVGVDAVGLMRKLKEVVDERWLMNPGKVVEWRRA